VYLFYLITLPAINFKNVVNMKKVFTSVCLAIMALLVMTPAMAQQRQLTDQEKAILANELVPVMLDQVKEISGLNFISLKSDLSIENIIASPLFTPVVSLRADQKAITIKPDSVKLDLSKVDGIPPAMAMFVSDIKLTFENYKGYAVNNGAIDLQIPGKIIASLAGAEMMSITITTGAQTGFLPFSSLTLDLSVGALLQSLLGTGGTLITFTETTASAGAYDYNLVIGQALKDLMALVSSETTLPNMLIKTDMSQMTTKGVIDASLYGLPGGTTQLPMGDATLYVNAAMQADSILLTSYDYSTGTAVKGYRKLAPTMEQKNAKDLVITNQDSVRTSTTDAWKWQATQVVTMTNQKATTIPSSVTQTINEVLTALLSGEGVDLTMKVDTIAGVSAAYTTTFKTTVTSEMGGNAQDPAVIANINMSSWDDDANALEESMKIKITLPTKSETIKIEFSPVVDGTATLMATAYMKSDLMTGGMSNETIENELKIALTEGGIWVSNIENGTYSIVNIQGAILAKGRIDSSSSFISTGGIPSGGVYILVVNEKGTQQSVKFIKK